MRTNDTADLDALLVAVDGVPAQRLYISPVYDAQVQALPVSGFELLQVSA
jgi:hypothetical protein